MLLNYRVDACPETREDFGAGILGTLGRDQQPSFDGYITFLVHIWLSNQLERRFVRTDPVPLEDPGHREVSIPYWRPFEIKE